jgi:mannose-1-phosphate guanylyltransferase
MTSPTPQALSHLHALLICTDSAERLWPLTHEDAPVELTVDPITGQSPLAHAIQAVRAYCVFPLVIAAPSAIAIKVREHIAEFGLLEKNQYHLLAEPWSRGSALTVALAAAHLKRTDANAIMLTLPVSLDFELGDLWEALVTRSWQAAAAERIVFVAAHQPVIGNQLVATIRAGAEIADEVGVHELRSYTLRPSPQVAWRARSSDALWSAHIYLMRANLALSELRGATAQNSGREYRELQGVSRIAETARFFVTLGPEHWANHDAQELVKTLPAISFEEALFESTERLAVVPTSLEFRDRGTFAGFEQCLAPDAAGNRLRGLAQANGSREVTILADSGRKVVVRGLQDVIIIDTAEGLLVSKRENL